jgi:hypothetical protein
MTKIQEMRELAAQLIEWGAPETEAYATALSAVYGVPALGETKINFCPKPHEQNEIPVSQ